MKAKLRERGREPIVTIAHTNMIIQLLAPANLACWDAENILASRHGSANLLSFNNCNHFI